MRVELRRFKEKLIWFVGATSPGDMLHRQFGASVTLWTVYRLLELGESSAESLALHIHPRLDTAKQRTKIEILEEAGDNLPPHRYTGYSSRRASLS